MFYCSRIVSTKTVDISKRMFSVCVLLFVSRLIFALFSKALGPLSCTYGQSGKCIIH